MFRKIILSLSLFLCAFTLAAQQLPEPMQPARLVNDFAGMLSPEQQQALEARLEAFDRETSTQIAVVTVNDLDGLDVSDYAARLFDKWGIGGKGKDNGILILVKPKTADSRGEVFIATGYGVEGAVPDALAGRIVDYDILPAFRSGDYYAGLDKAATTLMGLTRGEFTADQYLKKHKEKSLPGGSLVGIIVFFIIVVAILSSGSKGGGGNRHTYTSDGDMAKAILWGSILSGAARGGGGGFGGFSGGGGGFGGFGGGSTGGGGAGGSW